MIQITSHAATKPGERYEVEGGGGQAWRHNYIGFFQPTGACALTQGICYFFVLSGRNSLIHAEARDEISPGIFINSLLDSIDEITFGTTIIAAICFVD